MLLFPFHAVCGVLAMIFQRCCDVDVIPASICHTAENYILFLTVRSRGCYIMPYNHRYMIQGDVQP
jgi:hypothetical protein